MSSSAASSTLLLRPPSSSPATTVPSFSKPSIDFLKGSWHVTHSTLPMWKDNKNVVITYTPLDDGNIHDLVEYQPLNSSKSKTIKGIDRPHTDIEAAYNWRGKGWLMIASSHWEVLGHGPEDDGWVVTFFDKTLFTPAGIDIYARRKSGLSEELVQRIRAEMKKINDPLFQKQADEIFTIKHD